MNCLIWLSKTLFSPISHSNWAAPIVPIQKTSGGFRICGDFKVTVNKVCKPDSYPLPRIDDLYAKLSGGTVRSDDWVEALPSQRRLQLICSYVILLLLRVSTILFVFSSFHVVVFSIW